MNEYNQSIQQLVTRGFMAAIPKSKKGNEFSYWASVDKSEAIFRVKLSNQTFYSTPYPVDICKGPNPDPDCPPPPAS